MNKNKLFFIVLSAMLVLFAGAFFLVLLDVFNFNLNTSNNKLGNKIKVNSQRQNSSADPLITSAARIYRSFVRATDPVKGDQRASLLIMEFGDFECPYSAQLYPSLNKLLEDYQGQVKLVWKDFVPPIHLKGKQAAVAARCAVEQSKFWQFHDYLFSNQAELSADLYQRIAKEINLDMEKFNQCLNQPEKVMSLIGQGLADGQRLGVDGTPYLFVGNQKIDHLISFEELRAIVDNELKNINF